MFPVVPHYQTGNTEEYSYSSGNKRFWKQTKDASGNITGEEFYIYGADGRRIATYDSGMMPVYTPHKIDVYFGGRQIRSRGAAFESDRLGSVEAGATDFLPFGEEKTATANDRTKFATYHRDMTGLDYANQRYYASRIGQFLSADPYEASGGAAKPGSWNRYAYVGGDPVNFNDPSGLLDNCIQNMGPGPQVTCHTGDSITVNGNTDGAPYDWMRSYGNGYAGTPAGPRTDGENAAEYGNCVTQDGRNCWDIDYSKQAAQGVPPKRQDVALSITATQVLSEVYRRTSMIAQPACSGGGFVFVGGGGEIGGVHLEAYFLPISFDSGGGLSSGVLGELGFGKFALGGEGSIDWKNGDTSKAGLAFSSMTKEGTPPIPPVHLGLLADTHGNVGAYIAAGRGINVGAGIYARPVSFGCPKE